jgi:dTDP-glucose 4,6-dehydratase
MDGKKVPVYGDGLYVRDWLYVEDHCSAIEAMLEKGKIGQTYCVGSMTQDVSNIDIVKKICELMHVDAQETIEYVKDRPGHDRRYAIDFSKIQRELGWNPAHTFETALQTTIDWYRENESWWKHIKSGEYQSYYQQQYEQ